MEQAPYVIVDETITPETWWTAIANAPRHLQLIPRCEHCWHMPHDWQMGPSQVTPSRLCCWCGDSEGPRHGPYAPKGGP